MSDKFITQPPTNPTTQTYAQRRAAAAKRHLEAQPKPRAVREEEARRKALETSLFEREEGEAGGKAMGLMMKMGWKPGEGLGKRVEETKVRARGSSEDEDKADNDEADVSDDDGDAAAPGIGAKRRKLSPRRQTHRTEPLRISLWAGKSGLGTHQRSPSPENMSFLLRQSANPTPHGPGPALDLSADEFRRRRAEVDDAKRTLARQQAARQLLMEFDKEKGITFHPLWIIPSAPLETMPRPLIRLVDPETADTLLPDEDEGEGIRGRSPAGNVGAADRMREEMRRDALGEISDDEHEVIPEPKLKAKEETMRETDGEPSHIDWPSFIPAVHRVLRMNVSLILHTHKPSLTLSRFPACNTSIVFNRFPPDRTPLLFLVRGTVRERRGDGWARWVSRDGGG